MSLKYGFAVFAAVCNNRRKITENSRLLFTYTFWGPIIHGEIRRENEPQFYMFVIFEVNWNTLNPFVSDIDTIRFLWTSLYLPSARLLRKSASISEISFCAMWRASWNTHLSAFSLSYFICRMLSMFETIPSSTFTRSGYNNEYGTLDYLSEYGILLDYKSKYSIFD